MTGSSSENTVRDNWLTNTITKLPGAHPEVFLQHRITQAKLFVLYKERRMCYTKAEKDIRRGLVWKTRQ